MLSSDEGLYTCTATNTAGSVNTTMSLLVHGKLVFFFYVSFKTVEGKVENLSHNCDIIFFSLAFYHIREVFHIP